MDKAHTLTDKKLMEMEKKLHGIYGRAKKEVGESWKKYIAESSEKISALQAAYDAAKKTGDKNEIRSAGIALGKAKKEVTMLDGHYRRLTESLSMDISTVNGRAIAYTNGKLADIYALNYNHIAERIESTVSGYSFELVDAATIRNLATKEKTLLPYKRIDGAKDVRWNVQRVNSEVLQGILQGEPMDKIASRLSNVLDMNETSAIRNARTSVTSAENKGRMDMIHEAAEKGIVVHKVWMAANDSRTREAHAELDGEEVAEEEYFVNSIGEILYPGDPDAEPENTYNCRCSLGYKIIEINRR